MSGGTITFLGTGTSTGVPQIGCKCAVCRSADPRDKRLRCSALIETDGGARILVDCGPDFRLQMLGVPFAPLSAVLLTHEHYDHTGGLDDLRPFSAFGDVPVYADPLCAAHLRERIPYCFAENKYPGVPSIALREVTPGKPFSVGGEEVTPFGVLHDKLPILGYRIGSLAYITDMSCLAPGSRASLDGVRTLVVNALRLRPHHSHQSLSEALAFVRDIAPERAYLVHMSHQIGRHADVERVLPEGVRLAYDGLRVRW